MFKQICDFFRVAPKYQETVWLHCRKHICGRGGEELEFLMWPHKNHFPVSPYIDDAKLWLSQSNALCFINELPDDLRREFDQGNWQLRQVTMRLERP